MATMNQAIRQMLSRRTQLAALMVVVALAAAAFISLSERASAQGADDVTMELLVYFPEDSDGVVASKGSQPATGLERVPVTFELRVTVADAATKNVRWRAVEYRSDTAALRYRDLGAKPRRSSPTTLPIGLYPFDRGDAYHNVWDSVSANWFNVNGAVNGLADRFNRINVSGLRFWDVGTPTVYLDGRNESTGEGTSPDRVVWDCRPADNDADTARAADIDRPNRPAIPTDAGAVSCYLTVNGADPQVDIVAAADGTYTVSGQIRFFFPGGAGSMVTNADSITNGLSPIPSGERGRYIGMVAAVTWDGYDVDVTGLPTDNLPSGNDPNGEHIVVPQEVRDGSISGSATLRVKSIKEVASAALDFATHTAASSPCPTPSGVTRNTGDTCPSKISGVRGDRQTGFLLKVLNEDGAASNWNGIRRIQLDVRGISADIKASSYSGAGDATVTRECIGVAICSWNITATPGSQPWGGVSADKIGTLILKPAGTATGTAEVTATVYSASGERFTTETREVTITGRATKFDIAEPTSTLYRTYTADDDRDKLVLATTATDGGNNEVDGDRLRGSATKITGPGNKNETSKFETLSRNAKGQIEVQLKSTTTGTAALAVGTYKLEASIGTGTGLKDTVEFTVVDKAAAEDEDGISVEFDPAVPTTVGEEVTATVTVQDAAGNAVADGTTVTVSASDSAGTGAALRLVGNSNPKTKNGTASVRMVTIGDGLAIVTVTADGSVKVATVRSNAMSASQVRGVEGLSRSDVNQFASWEPGNNVQASELFGELRSRGAGAIYRWDQATRAWQRYATDASGRELPGSVNFQIARGDTLYIAG